MRACTHLVVTVPWMSPSRFFQAMPWTTTTVPVQPNDWRLHGGRTTRRRSQSVPSTFRYGHYERPQTLEEQCLGGGSSSFPKSLDLMHNLYLGWLQYFFGSVYITIGVMNAWTWDPLPPNLRTVWNSCTGHATKN